MRLLADFLHRFGRDQRGVIGVSFAVVLVVMLGSTLFAVDMARYNIAQSRIQDALDATLVSIGRNLPLYVGPTPDPGQMAELRQDVLDYFYANISPDYFDASIQPDAVTITLTQDGATDPLPGAQRITLHAQGTLPLYSTAFFKMTAMSLQATSGAIRQLRNNMEMVLALDSSSTADPVMQTADLTTADEARLTAVKTQASNLADTVLSVAAANAGGTAQTNTYVGVVPFTDFVNVKNIPPAIGTMTYSSPSAAGTYTSGWLRIRPEEYDFLATSRADGGWGGCISEPAPINPPSYDQWALPGGGTNASLPASVLTPLSGFLPAYAVFGYQFDPPKIASDAAGYLMPYSGYSSLPTGYPDLLPQIPGITFNSHDSSLTNLFRVIVVAPYKYFQYGWPPYPGTDTNPSHMEPHHFWMYLATHSTYVSPGPIDTCLSPQVLFLSNQQSTVDTTIGTIANFAPVTRKLDGSVYSTTVPVGGGSTPPVGLLWSWRMLSPVWRGTSGWGSTTLPRDPAPGLRKIVVLFANADGSPLVKHESDDAYSHLSKLGYAYSGGSGSGLVKVDPINITIDVTQPDPTTGLTNPLAFTQCPLNGLRTVDPERLIRSANLLDYRSDCTTNTTSIGYPSDSTLTNALTSTSVNAYMNDVCTNIKADGIEVYTVMWGGTAADRARFQSCASSPENAFDASDAATLSASFRQIAATVTEVRMVL